MKAKDYISKGVYTPADAARLLGVDTRAVRRWAFGYRRRGRRYRAAIATDLPESHGARAITFRELVELMFIRGFVETGIPWRKIRLAADTAARMYQTDHPFAFRRWFADPAGIYAEVTDAAEDTAFVEMSGAGQTAMRSILAMYLEQLDFDVEGYAARWYPLGKDAPVVIDPERAFGTATVRGTRVPTTVLAELYEGPDSVDEIAWVFELQPSEVHAAIRFERTRAA